MLAEAPQISVDEIRKQADLIDSNFLKLRGALISLRRLEQHITQDALAEKADISRPTISKIELGEGACRDLTLTKIYNALDILDDEVQKLKKAAETIDPDNLFGMVFADRPDLKIVFDDANEAVVQMSRNVEHDQFSRIAVVSAILKGVSFP